MQTRGAGNPWFPAQSPTYAQCEGKARALSPGSGQLGLAVGRRPGLKAPPPQPRLPPYFPGARMAHPPADTYDYIIIGAGSSGCVLAARLTEDPNLKVLVLEAGGKDSHPYI